MATAYDASVEVTVRLFAMLRQRAGKDEVVLELPEGAKVDDALAALGDLAEDLPLVMAVNREYAPGHHVLSAGDELALIPPVSGGDGSVHAAVRPARCRWTGSPPACAIRAPAPWSPSRA